MKILSMGAVFFHAKRRTDTTKLTVVVRNFAKALKTKVIPVIIAGNRKNLIIIHTISGVYTWKERQQ